MRVCYGYSWQQFAPFTVGMLCSRDSSGGWELQMGDIPGLFSHRKTTNKAYLGLGGCYSSRGQSAEKAVSSPGIRAGRNRIVPPKWPIVRLSVLRAWRTAPILAVVSEDWSFVGPWRTRSSMTWPFFKTDGEDGQSGKSTGSKCEFWLTIRRNAQLRVLGLKNTRPLKKIDKSSSHPDKSDCPSCSRNFSYGKKLELIRVRLKNNFIKIGLLDLWLYFEEGRKVSLVVK